MYILWIELFFVRLQFKNKDINNLIDFEINIKYLHVEHIQKFHLYSLYYIIIVINSMNK